MKRNIQVLLTMSLINSALLLGQNEKTQVNIEVLDKELGIANAYVYLVGEKNDFYITDPNGTCSFFLHNNGVKNIWIVCPGYKMQHISPSSLLKSPNAQIQLIPNSIYIDEVTITPKRNFLGKRKVKQVHDNINTFFINQDFSSDIHVVQHAERNQKIVKYKEAYLSVYHPNGYQKMSGLDHIKQIVYKGEIRETDEKTLKQLNGRMGYTILSEPYDYLRLDICKYKHFLWSEMNNYDFNIIDTVRDNNGKANYIIYCKKNNDTIRASDKNFVSKTDYFLTINSSYKIESATINNIMRYKRNNKQRLYSNIAKIYYTHFEENNYVDSIVVNIRDKLITKGNENNEPTKEEMNIYTKLTTTNVDIGKRKMKEKQIPQNINYNSKFWENQPLLLNNQ